MSGIIYKQRSLKSFEKYYQCFDILLYLIYQVLRRQVNTNDKYLPFQKYCFINVKITQFKDQSSPFYYFYKSTLDHVRVLTLINESIENFLKQYFRGNIILLTIIHFFNRHLLVCCYLMKLYHSDGGLDLCSSC